MTIGRAFLGWLICQVEPSLYDELVEENLMMRIDESSGKALIALIQMQIEKAAELGIASKVVIEDGPAGSRRAPDRVTIEVAPSELAKVSRNGRPWESGR